MKYGDVTLGQIEAVINKLGGREGVRRLLSGDVVIRETESKFQVWRTIRLGTGLKTADDFCRALREGKFRFGDDSSAMLKTPNFKVAGKKTEIDLVKVRATELGFETKARLDQIYERAQKLGLELCPSEVGPQLRLQYQDQPVGETTFIAMKPIPGPGGEPYIFSVNHFGNLCLLTRWSEISADCFPGNYYWAFCRPRK